MKFLRALKPLMLGFAIGCAVAIGNIGVTEFVNTVVVGESVPQARYTPPTMVAPAKAAGVTDYTENKVVDHIFRATAWTAPTVLCVALTTTAPSDSAAGTEASYTGYARGCLNPSTANWKSTNGTTSGASSGTSGQTCNASTITFGSAATSGPQTVTHFELWDASSGGNRLYYGTLTASKTINNGDPAPTAPADAICFTPGD